MNARRALRVPTLGLVAGTAALLAAVALASDPPHWEGLANPIGCGSASTQGCHLLHKAPGAGLSKVGGNANLCQSCHLPGGIAKDLAIATADIAVMDVRGIHHAWDANAANATAGATTPTNPAMALRLDTTTVPGQSRIICSTCHNQHASVSATGGTARVGKVKQLTSSGSTGVVTAGGTYSGTTGVWYLLEITTDGALGTAQFRYSKDNGRSWFAARATAASVTLDSGVSVSFSAGNYSVGPPAEQWEFSAGWPFLRAAMDSGGLADAGRTDFCRDCHRSWTMGHVDVVVGGTTVPGTRTYTGTARSHPVGVALGENGSGYDRATPLDADGAAQAVGATAFSDLHLDSGGHVQCMTCHATHYARSYSKAVLP